MKAMQAMQFTQYGSPELLRLTDVIKPTPGLNEVLVKVFAAAVNQADNHVLSGSLRFSTGLFKPRQRIPGSDVAGIVEAVGANVTRFQPGDAVFGDLSGLGRRGFAEFVAAPQDAWAQKPANLSFAAAAAVPMTAVTALQGLRDKGELQPGQDVLINGASGGVGTFAVQIGKALGGAVTAVVSTRNVDMVRSLGADYIIDYTQQDFTQIGQQYDLIFDTVGNRTVADYTRALKPQGRFVTTAFLPSLVFRGLWRSLFGGRKMLNMMARPSQHDLDVLRELIERDRIIPVIDRCYPLSAVPDALRYLAEGHAKGKVIIMLPDSPVTE